MLFIPQLEFEYKMNEANICVCGCDLGPVGLADGDHAEGPQPPHNWRPGPASHRIYTHTGDRHLLREAALNIKIQEQFTHICMICIILHSVPECGFEVLKTYHTPAHIWHSPRLWKTLLLISKIIHMRTCALSYQFKGPLTVNWLFS